MPAKATSRRISRKPLYAEVVEGIREMIIGGRLTPGARLVESELCEMFGISRTPFREALKLLESEGLVVLKPNRGATGSVMTEQEITDLFELVASLERSAVELAVQRMDDKALAKLRKQHDRMMKLHAAHKRRECFQVDYEIHQLIVAATGNAALITTHAGFMVRTRRARYLALSLQSRWDESMHEHEQFMTAIEQRDGRLAGELMLAHVSQTGQVVREAFLSANPAGKKVRPASRGTRPGANKRDPQPVTSK